MVIHGKINPIFGGMLKMCSPGPILKVKSLIACSGDPKMKGIDEMLGGETRIRCVLFDLHPREFYTGRLRAGTETDKLIVNDVQAEKTCQKGNSGGVACHVQTSDLAEGKVLRPSNF